MNVYAVIMAGGSGTRFWPLSREMTPKQVLSIMGTGNLLRDTIDRLDGLIDREHLLVVTSRQQLEVIAPHLQDLDEANILIEPTPRNTAPCIGLAAIHIHRIDPDGIMLVLPSDHRITDTAAFQRIVRIGIEVVREKDPLVTFGIPPTRPETGYGYVQFDLNSNGSREEVYRVKTFAEKPGPETARRFVKAGDFFWNSGIFLWSARRILAEMGEHLPEQYEQLRKIEKAYAGNDYEKRLTGFYNRIKPISIDYGIMEVATSSIFMLKGDFGWSDVGSWDELYRILPKGARGNVNVGKTVAIDANNNLLYSQGKITAVIGLDNILVVNTPDATLICPLNRAQDVKLVVEKLRREGKKEYL